jgi:hypothetical protein
MYGFASKETAEAKAAELTARNDGNRYYVAVHKHPESNIWGSGDKTTTWGVVRWATYCPAMLWRHDGFVWF